MGQQGLFVTNGPFCACVLTEAGAGEQPLGPRSRSGGPESPLPSEQLDSQRHMLYGGQLVCKRAEAQDSNCFKGLFVYYVGRDFN